MRTQLCLRDLDEGLAGTKQLRSPRQGYTKRKQIEGTGNSWEEGYAETVQVYSRVAPLDDQWKYIKHVQLCVAI